MDSELRCPSRMYGVLKNGLLEVKCTSKFCGADKHTVVYHYFKISGNSTYLVKTNKHRPAEEAFARQRPGSPQ